MLPTALDVAAKLLVHKIEVQVISLHTIKPLDSHCLSDVFSSFSCVISLEEHSLIGGLGTSLAEWLVDQHIAYPHFLRFGTPDRFPSRVGSQTYLRRHYQLDATSITQKILTYLDQKEVLCKHKQLS